MAIGYNLKPGKKIDWHTFFISSYTKGNNYSHIINGSNFRYMKKLIGIIAIASIIAACNGNTTSNSQDNLNAIKRYNDSLKLDSFRKVEVLEKQKLAEEKEQTALAAKVAAEKRAVRAESRANRSYSSNSVSQPVYQQQQAPAKKGWSSAAKGAVIGGVVGAGTGVLIDKKDGRGAVIGGVVGAGTGYVIGRSRDRKSGRVQ